MEFDTAITHTDQGNIGEARAVAELTKLGYEVLIPFTNNNKYDLVVTKDGVKFNTIQVKTSSAKPNDDAGWHVSLMTRGSSKTKTTSRARKNGDYDYLFALVNDGRCWLIPEISINVSSMVCLGGTTMQSKYHEFELNVDEKFVPKRKSVLDNYPPELVYKIFKYNNNIVAHTLNELGSTNLKDDSVLLREICERFICDPNDLHEGALILKDLKCKHFTGVELQELVNRLPLTKIGKQCGISDNAVKKWVDKWNIVIPPRGYFLRK